MKYFEEYRTQLLKEGQKDIKPRAIKVEKARSYGNQVYRVRYEVTYLDKEIQKRLKFIQVKETYQDLNIANQREAFLLAIRKGIESKFEQQILPGKEKSIKEYCDEFLTSRKNDLIENRWVSVDKVNKHTETYELNVCCKDFLNFIHRKGIEFFSQIEENDQILVNYKSELMKKPVTLVKGKIKVEGDRTLSISAINKRIAFLINLVRYVQKRGNSPIRRHLYEVSKVTKKEEKLLVGQESTRFQGKTRVLNKEEIQAIYNNIARYWIVPFAFSICTGCRSGKVLHLLDEEVDMENKVLNLLGYKEVRFKDQLYINRQKSGEPLLIPMSDELHEIMKIHFEWKNSISVDTPFTFFIPGTTNLSIDQTGHPRKNNFRREILAGANRAGVKTEGVNVKCLRLSRASELLTRSIEDSIESSQAMLGHADPYITKRHYIKPTFEFFDKLREKLNKNQYDFNLAHLRNVLEIPDPASNSLRAETMK